MRGFSKFSFIVIFVFSLLDKALSFHFNNLLHPSSCIKNVNVRPRISITELFIERKTKGSARGDGIRQYRVARSIRDELSNIISNADIRASSYPDEGLLRATSIIDVDLSPDLSFAKVYISVLGNSVERRQVFVWLCENAGQVRHSLSKRLKHMRRLPDIFFKLSDSQASAELVSLIESIVPETRNDSDDDYEFDEDDDDDEDEDN